MIKQDNTMKKNLSQSYRLITLLLLLTFCAPTANSTPPEIIYDDDGPSHTQYALTTQHLVGTGLDMIKVIAIVAEAPIALTLSYGAHVASTLRTMHTLDEIDNQTHYDLSYLHMLQAGRLLTTTIEGLCTLGYWFTGEPTFLAATAGCIATRHYFFSS